METFFVVLRALIPFTGVFFVIGFTYIMNRKICGKYLRDKYSVPFLEKWLPEARLNMFDTTIIQHKTGDMDLGYITTCNQIFAKWRMRGVGRFPKWSKAHRMIEAKRRELILKV